ncbi:MAG: TlpA family protein disulfide reductase [Prevotella sp.]|nr:TlpA family protein disulfide reductase [Prevotella sp.]
MNKQTIITCLRGTIGRWLKGKAIVLPVLVLILPLSPWRGVRCEAAGQTQTKTATITGYSPALKDSTVTECSVENVRVASDTVIGGHFTLTVPVEGLTKSYLFLEGEGCPNHLMTIWLIPGVDVKVTGTDCLYPLWKVDSPVPEQQTLSRITEYGRDTLAEMLRLGLANAPWEEEKAVYMKYLKQTMDILPSLPVDAASLDELEEVAMMARNYQKDFPYMEQLKELEAFTAARAPKGFEEQLALIHTQVYPPHVLQVGEEAIDAELTDMQGQKHHLAEMFGQPGRYVLLDFWSLGCYPCRISEPEMRWVYEQSQGKLEIIGINQDKLSAWQEDNFSKSIAWKNWNDGKIGKADVENHYCDMKAIPYYVLISPDKSILWKGAGYGAGWFLGMAEAISGPKQDNTANLQLAVRSIGIKPDATTISFRYYGQEGYWFRIVKDSYLEANGKKCKVTAADGITLDTEIYPKEKATTVTEGVMGKLLFTDFTLTFEPFDTMPATFDFKEGDGEGAFVIRNITIE